MYFALAFTAFVIGISAFSQQQNGNRDSFRKKNFSKDNDTAASGKLYRDGNNWDFDKLDLQMKQLEGQMKNLEIQMKDLDLSAYQKQADAAILKIDMNEIQEQIDESLKNADLANLNSELSESMQELNKLNWAQAEKQLKRAKVNLNKQKAELKLNFPKLNADMKMAMKNAQKSITSAKEELKNLTDFTDALEKDGLIDKSKAFRIEVKNGELYINEKKQPKEVSEKYRKYYKKSNFTIDTNEENGIRI